jgi:hypothetical protein
MEVTNFNSREIYGEHHGEYGVVNDDGSRAFVVQVDDFGPTTYITCRAGYSGEDLTFDGDDNISDPSNGHTPTDSIGRRLSLEIEPPITDAEARLQAVSAYAASVLDAARLGGLLELPGIM